MGNSVGLKRTDGATHTGNQHQIAASRRALCAAGLKRYSPDELYAKFKQLHDAVSANEFYSSPTHKKTQELYCAARFGQALRQVQACWLHVADVDEQTDADFHLEVAGVLLPFQITEVQIPGRRRGDEYKLSELPRATIASWDF